MPTRFGLWPPPCKWTHICELANFVFRLSSCFHTKHTRYFSCKLHHVPPLCKWIHNCELAKVCAHASMQRCSVRSSICLHTRHTDIVLARCILWGVRVLSTIQMDHKITFEKLLLFPCCTHSSLHEQVLAIDVVWPRRWGHHFHGAATVKTYGVRSAGQHSRTPTLFVHAATLEIL